MPPTADVAPATLSRAHAEAIVESYLLAIAGSQELSDKAVRQTVAALCKLILEPDR